MQTFESAADALLAKLKASPRYRQLTDEEYQELKLRQFTRLAMQEREQAKQNQLAALERIGLHESELILEWTAVAPGISDGIKAVEAVRPAYERGWGMVFLWGSYGQAKTLVGKILTASAFRDGKHAAYANVAGVLDDIRLAFDEQERKTTELLHRMDFWISRDVLFLDELDKVNGTDWAQERIFQLLDQRYMRAIREEALTVIASNKSDDALDGYLKSRLQDRRLGPLVRLDGADGRQFVPDGWRF